MVDENKKIITVSFVLSGILVALTLSLLLEFFAQSFATLAKVQGNAELANGIPVGLGILTFILLQFNSRTVAFADGVVAELKKVVWPSKRDTWLMTIVVIITLIISGILVGVYDAIWAYVINMFIK